MSKLSFCEASALVTSAKDLAFHHLRADLSGLSYLRGGLVAIFCLVDVVTEDVFRREVYEWMEFAGFVPSTRNGVVLNRVRRSRWSMPDTSRVFILDLLKAIRHSTHTARFARAQYARAVQDVLALLPPEASKAGMFACQAQVHAWIIEDLLADHDTEPTPLLEWASKYRVDLDAVRAELAGIQEYVLPGALAATLDRLLLHFDEGQVPL